MSEPFVDIALAAAQATIAEARARGLRVAVVVLDASFTEAAVLRLDGAFPSTVAVARAKAHTSLNFGQPSSKMAEAVTPENKAALVSVDPRMMIVGGAVPLRADADLVGALGVSGASEADDSALAEVGAAVAASLLAGG